MAKLPRPAIRPLPTVAADELTTVAADESWWRVYASASAYPMAWNQLRHFGPRPQSRFDHQRPPPHVDGQRGICYLGSSPHVCIAEAFQDTRTIDRAAGGACIAEFLTHRPVLCLDLCGAWPTRVGASQAISSGRRDVARLWSQAIHDDFPTVQGIVYPSSMFGGGRCLALYERGISLFPATPRFNRLLKDPGLDTVLPRIAGAIGYVIV